MFESEIKIPVYVAEDPLTAVVRGTGIILEDLDKMREVLLQHDEDIPQNRSGLVSLSRFAGAPARRTSRRRGKKHGFSFLRFLPCLARPMETQEVLR